MNSHGIRPSRPPLPAPDLVTLENREPIKATANRIDRTVETARLLCRQGKLAHMIDAGGRYWSSKDAAIAFSTKRTRIDTESQSADYWLRRAKELVS